uniref:DUF3105 domain-containing protein n=1 Tax=Cuerna arida TaxID=1464854 RepID=A0A1B6GZR6_9HEMI
MQPLLFVVILILGLSLAEKREDGLNVLFKGMNDDLDDMKKDLEEKIKRDTEVVPEPVESWTGKWFPEITTAAPSKVPSAVPAASGMDGNNMWQMINSTCDDGKQNLTVDWEPNSFDYECEGPYLEPDLDVKATLEQEYIPPAYVARHVCMKSKIPYNQPLPTFGPHRPAWAKYGEYTYLPIQRFLHNMEHGGVIMLYHPCTHPALVNKLKKIVKSCLYRHVITASRLVPRDRPLALMTWGWRLLMPTVDTSLAVEFIREHALHGYEKTHRDGFYDQLLVAPAAIVSTPDDQVICPRFKGV